ncbi:MAG: KTSC domain-containing protein [Duodenibacillus sp.]|nr:KTSC domain-containing protein [Duodenibacillus sp.]
MQRRSIHRGGILSAGYDRARRELEIEFDTRRIVRYSGVSSEVGERLLNSAAPESFFRDVIEGEYPGQEVSAKDAARRAPEKKKGVPDALRQLFGDL